MCLCCKHTEDEEEEVYKPPPKPREEEIFLTNLQEINVNGGFYTMPPSSNAPYFLDPKVDDDLDPSDTPLSSRSSNNQESGSSDLGDDEDSAVSV